MGRLAPGRYEVDIDDIRVDNRMRTLREGRIAALAHSIERIGLLHPPTIRVDGQLVAGAGRLAAVKRLGWTRVQVDVREFADLEAQLAEVDENLRGATLSVQEQSEHLKRWREILAEMGMLAAPVKFVEGGVHDPAINAGSLVTTADIGQEVGLSERAVRQRFQIADMPQGVRDLTRQTEVADSLHDLIALALLVPEEQLEVAREISEGAVSVAEAQRRLHPAEVGAPDAPPLEADIPERLNTVWVEIRVEFRVPSRRTRKRGDKVYLRESEDAVHVIQVSLDGALREQGDEGLRSALSQAASKAFHDEALMADWKLLPPVGTREVA
jgi:ParB family chromosome partitioning protein